MKVLCISDRVDSMLYGSSLNGYAGGVEAVISCGDLPFEYLEYIVTFLGVPLYYVLGNHDPAPDDKFPGGCVPLDGDVVEIGDGVVVAGLSGSPFYSDGPNQYTERQMKRKASALSTRIRVRSVFGRPKPNVFVSHASPFGIGDRDDMAHVGFRSFVRQIDRYAPKKWLHGHVHLYGPNNQRVHERGQTDVINVYGHQFVDI